MVTLLRGFRLLGHLIIDDNVSVKVTAKSAIFLIDLGLNSREEGVRWGFLHSLCFIAFEKGGDTSHHYH